MSVFTEKFYEAIKSLCKVEGFIQWSRETDHQTEIIKEIEWVIGMLQELIDSDIL